MLFAAATDHRYLDGGHTLDFVNKALEALDTGRLGSRRGRPRLAARAARRRRADGGVERLAQPGRPGRAARGAPSSELPRRSRPASPAAAGTAATRSSRRVLGDEPAAILDALLAALREGADRGRARLGGRLRRRDADRPLPDEQRVRRLGHRAAHLHLRERGRAGPAPLALAGAAARRARRRDERPPRPLPQRPRQRLPAPQPAPTRRRCSPSCRACSTASSRSTRPASSSRRYLGAGGDPRRLIAALGACLAARGPRTSTRSSASRRPCASTSCSRRGGAVPDRRRTLSRRARADGALAAPDVRDRAAPPPRRAGLRRRRPV